MYSKCHVDKWTKLLDALIFDSFSFDRVNGCDFLGAEMLFLSNLTLPSIQGHLTATNGFSWAICLAMHHRHAEKICHNEEWYESHVKNVIFAYLRISKKWWIIKTHLKSSVNHTLIIWLKEMTAKCKLLLANQCRTCLCTSPFFTPRPDPNLCQAA